jgi:threonine dehydrogenase-like Zn-dependent dehydrogenase
MQGVTSRYYVGVDLGQTQDYTAIAVVERVELKGEWDAVEFAWRKVVALRLRHLERVPLGTSYVDVVERAARVTRTSKLAGRCELVVDATGVGRPVVDLLRKTRMGGKIIPVTFTGGNTESRTNGYYGVPKRDLITGLKILLQRGALQIAAGMEYGPALVKEMGDMRVKVTRSGYEQFEAWREGTHDDLVFAVALACWRAQKAFPHELAGADAHWRQPMQGGFG